ncbi:MAG: TetR/AcrR family transcriptional regulator [Faecalibacterium sp.]
MEKSTRERILEQALALFARSGYSGTSMSEIAAQVGVTKAALYRHFAGKEDILAAILARMEQQDTAQAQQHDMPLSDPAQPGGDYAGLTARQICGYTKEMFLYWTQDLFAADFRRMLTLEQHRSPEMNQLFQQYLAAGPVEYMAEVFHTGKRSREQAYDRALEFYGPVFLLYSVYDGTKDKQMVLAQLDRFLERFCAALQMEETAE